MSDIEIGNEQLRVRVSPLGAEMQALETSDGASWLWTGDAAFWTGRAPVLFPMVGRAPDDHISVDGQRYGMAQHGFARRSSFTLVSREAQACCFALQADGASRAVYPFDFRLTITHRVEGRAVEVTADVYNLDTRPMPYGIGFHPAFAWPLPGCAGQVHSVVLDSVAEPGLKRLSGGLVQPAVLPSPFKQGRLDLDEALFAQDAMLFPSGAGAGLRYGAGARAIHFTWENLPNLALWSKPGAPFVCLEPWHGTAAEVGGPAELAQRPFAVLLGPGAQARYRYRAELQG